MERKVLKHEHKIHFPFPCYNKEIKTKFTGQLMADSPHRPRIALLSREIFRPVLSIEPG